MRYLSLYRPLTGEEAAMPEPDHMAAMGRLVEEVIELAKTFLKVAGDGECEIRQIMEFGPPPA